MPGIPCIYYGSEWGARAWKEEGESALRACFDAGSGSGEEHLNGQKVELMLTMTFMIFQRAAS